MYLNENWRVLVLSDKSTYPGNSKRIVHIYVLGNGDAKFNVLGYVRDGRIYDINGNLCVFDDSVTMFWCYPPQFPTCATCRNSKKCGKENLDCEYEDDGYCLAEFGKSKCKYIRYVKEYYAYND